MRLPDTALVHRLLGSVATQPTAPYHEDAPAAAVRAELEALGLPVRTDEYGNLLAERRTGAPGQTVAFVAHLDHPAFEVVKASGTRGRARVRGGFFTEMLADARVVVHRGSETFGARVSDFQRRIDRLDWSPGDVRIEADRDLRVGDWAMLDLAPFEREGDLLRFRAADDLALCATALGALHLLAEERRPHHAYALFTRAEEPGLFGARLVAESGFLPRDALVISLEASRALPGAELGAGPVVRVGDMHHTFDDRAESFLRVARERLALLDPPVSVQRQLMYGGTCEASAFLDAGYRATAVALPTRNYHNRGPGGPAPEILHLEDVRAGIALLAEAAVAAGEDAREAYAADIGAVPEEIRRLLRP